MTRSSDDPQGERPGAGGETAGGSSRAATPVGAPAGGQSSTGGQSPTGGQSAVSGPSGGGPESARSAKSGAAGAGGPAGFDEKGHVQRGRASTTWFGLIVAAVLFVLLIIFIAQNQHKATIHFLGFSGHLPVSLLALIAVLVGVFMAAIPGTIRIVQLRKALKANTPKEQRQRRK